MMSTTHRAAMTKELNGVVLAGQMMRKRLVFLSSQSVRVASRPSKDLEDAKTGIHPIVQLRQKLFVKDFKGVFQLWKKQWPNQS